MKKTTICAAFLLSAATLAAQPGPGMNMPDVPAAIPSVLAIRIAPGDAAASPSTPAAIEVEVLRDVIYVDRDGMELHLNIFRPLSDAEPLPCVVYIPGSAWMKQMLEMSTPNLTRLAARGYVVAAVEYRPSDVARFPAQVQDAKTAVRFMRRNAALYHVDTDNVYVWGDSSGGHTALFVGATAGRADLDTAVYGEFPVAVNAIVDFYGPSELIEMNDDPGVIDHSSPTAPESLLIGGTVNEFPDLARAASPVHYIDTSCPPTLVAHGDRDPLVHLSQSDLVAGALHDAGVEFRYYCIEGAGHGGPQFWSDAMLDTVVGFLDKHSR